MMTHLQRWAAADQATPRAPAEHAQTTETKSPGGLHGLSREPAGSRGYDGWIIVGFAAFNIVVFVTMWLTSAGSEAFGTDLAAALALL